MSKRAQRRKDFERTPVAMGPDGPYNPKAEHGCRYCGGYGIVMEELGATYLCPKCWTKHVDQHDEGM